MGSTRPPLSSLHPHLNPSPCSVDANWLVYLERRSHRETLGRVPSASHMLPMAAHGTLFRRPSLTQFAETADPPPLRPTTIMEGVVMMENVPYSVTLHPKFYTLNPQPSNHKP